MCVRSSRHIHTPTHTRRNDTTPIVPIAPIERRSSTDRAPIAPIAPYRCGFALYRCGFALYRCDFAPYRCGFALYRCGLALLSLRSRALSLWFSALSRRSGVNSRPIGARSLPLHVDRGANSRPVAVISRQIGVVGVVDVVGAPPLATSFRKATWRSTLVGLHGTVGGLGVSSRDLFTARGPLKMPRRARWHKPA